MRGHEGREADNLRFQYAIERASAVEGQDSNHTTRRRELGLGAIRAEREKLEALRSNDRLGINSYLQLQEELDWRELTLLSDDDRRIEEI